MESRPPQIPAIPVTVKALYISQGHDFKGHHGKPRGTNPVESASSIDCEAGLGIVGDRYYGHRENYKGQITFFDWAVVLAARSKFTLPGLDPSVFRRNVLVEGLDLNSLVGETFSIQGVLFEGTEECAPCYWMDQAVAPGTEAFLLHQGGLRARILQSGRLLLGAGTCSRTAPGS